MSGALRCAMSSLIAMKLPIVSESAVGSNLTSAAHAALDKWALKRFFVVDLMKKTFGLIAPSESRWMMWSRTHDSRGWLRSKQTGAVRPRCARKVCAFLNTVLAAAG